MTRKGKRRRKYENSNQEIKKTCKPHDSTTNMDMEQLKNNLTADLEFIVECPNLGDNPPEPVPFDITPGTLENVKRSSLKNIPHFRITGKLHRTNCQVCFPDHTLTASFDLN